MSVVPSTLVDYTYSVVKFIVNVRLVENSANKNVGRVMLEKVMTQISIPGIPLAMATRT